MFACQRLLIEQLWIVLFPSNHTKYSAIIFIMSLSENPYSLTESEVFQKLGSSKKGLSQEEAASRLGQFGPNKITSKKRISPFTLFLEQFKSSLILILIGAAILVFFVYFFGEQKDQSDLIEGSLILAIVLIITILGFIQEYKAEKAVEALKKLLAFKAKVIRDGVEHEVDVATLVAGDVVVLEEGSKVPADLRLLEVAELSVLEASLTGESNPVSKKPEVLSGEVAIGDQANMAFSSTVVVAGRGLCIVVATADKTEIGKIATEVAEQKEEITPLQKRLDEVGKLLGYVVLAVCAVVFVFIVFLSSETKELAVFDRVIKSFVAAVSLAVAAIPEGLPAVVTIALALGTQRMLKRNTLVRKLSSVETLGSVDVICSDKTGTLTKGEMTVQEIYFDNQVLSVTGVGYGREGEFQKNGQKTDELPTLLLEAGLACNNAVLDDGKVLGDPTEGALIVSAAKAAVVQKPERIKELPFSSERKMMSVIVKDKDSQVVYTKGAPEVVLAACKSIYENGAEKEFTDKDREEILNTVAQMSSRALRTLGFAFKKVPAEIDDKQIEQDLVFLGLQGMIDPPRDEVKPLISQCNASGIRVIMITGDHLATAEAVAKNIGIIGKSLSGIAADQLSEEEFSKAVEETNVYARVSPTFKMRVVEALKKHDHIVAMTGDGVNDAPAVKKADIGIAMGITGTDVAKEASDMVLLDDNFKTIVAAIEEGRGIFQNIRKFVNYLLSCNIAEVLVVFFALLLFNHQPLSAVMLLWINIVTDGLPAVALGLDPASKGVMKVSPKRFQGQVIDKRLWVEMVVFGTLLTIGVLGIYKINIDSEGVKEASAAAFMAIVFFQLVRLLIVRLDYKTPFFSNGWLLVSVLVSIGLQLAIIYIPFLASIFEVTHIDLFDWVYILVGSLILWVVFESIQHFFDKVLKLNSEVN